MSNMYVRSAKPSNVFKFVIVTLVLLLLMGCTYKETEKSYAKKYVQLRESAVSDCESHGQKYVNHYTTNLKSWEVQCVQTSPFRVFTRELK